MAEKTNFGDSELSKQQQVILHEDSMDRAPEYNEIDPWGLTQNASQKDEKSALLRKNYSHIGSRDVQFLNDFESLGPPSVNLFITDIFIEGIYEHGPKWKTITNSRRCLIDTGADVNIITTNALQGLLSDIQPFSGCVHGAGGRAEVIALAKLNWHLKSRCLPVGGRDPDPLNLFVVVDPTTPYSFDCVLGRPWIQKHMFIINWICLKQRFFASKAWKKSFLGESLSGRFPRLKRWSKATVRPTDQMPLSSATSSAPRILD